MQRNLKIKVFDATSEEAGREAIQLNFRNQQNPGWQSSQNCIYPQTIILEIEDGICRINAIQILCHEFKIPKSMEISVGKFAEVGGSMHNTEQGDKSRDSSRQAEVPMSFTDLGEISFNNNEDKNFQYNELKSISLDAYGQLIKLAFKEPHQNKHNTHKQIGIRAVKVQGYTMDDMQALRYHEIQISPINKAALQPQPKQITSDSQHLDRTTPIDGQRRRNRIKEGNEDYGSKLKGQDDKVLPASYFYSPSSSINMYLRLRKDQNSDNDAQNAKMNKNNVNIDMNAHYQQNALIKMAKELQQLKRMGIDPVTAQQIAELDRLKDIKIAQEEYDEAQKIKEIINQLKQNAEVLAELEKQKLQKILSEDFEEAQRLKNQIEQVRRDCFGTSDEDGNEDQVWKTQNTSPDSLFPSPSQSQKIKSSPQTPSYPQTAKTLITLQSQSKQKSGSRSPSQKSAVVLKQEDKQEDKQDQQQLKQNKDPIPYDEMPLPAVAKGLNAYQIDDQQNENDNPFGKKGDNQIQLEKDNKQDDQDKEKDKKDDLLTPDQQEFASVYGADIITLINSKLWNDRVKGFDLLKEIFQNEQSKKYQQLNKSQPKQSSSSNDTQIEINDYFFQQAPLLLIPIIRKETHPQVLQSLVNSILALFILSATYSLPKQIFQSPSQLVKQLRDSLNQNNISQQDSNAEKISIQSSSKVSSKSKSKTNSKVKAKVKQQQIKQQSQSLSSLEPNNKETQINFPKITGQPFLPLFDSIFPPLFNIIITSKPNLYDKLIPAVETIAKIASNVSSYGEGQGININFGVKISKQQDGEDDQDEETNNNIKLWVSLNSFCKHIILHSINVNLNQSLQPSSLQSSISQSRLRGKINPKSNVNVLVDLGPSVILLRFNRNIQIASNGKQINVIETKSLISSSSSSTASQPKLQSLSPISKAKAKQQPSTSQLPQLQTIQYPYSQTTSLIPSEHLSSFKVQFITELFPFIIIPAVQSETPKTQERKVLLLYDIINELMNEVLNTDYEVDNDKGDINSQMAANNKSDIVESIVNLEFILGYALAVLQSTIPETKSAALDLMKLLAKLIPDKTQLAVESSPSIKTDIANIILLITEQQLAEKQKKDQIKQKQQQIKQQQEIKQQQQQQPITGQPKSQQSQVRIDDNDEVDPEDQDWTFCEYCGQENSNWNMKAVYAHWEYVCPMLLQCNLCSGIVRIDYLIAHRLDECSFRHLWRECQRCKEPILLQEYTGHVNRVTCQIAQDQSKFMRCTLCHQDLQIIGSKDETWLKHLTFPPYCAGNMRTRGWMSVQNQQGMGTLTSLMKKATKAK